MPFSPKPRRADPEPLEADDVRIITIGTVVWGLALVASIALRDRLVEARNEDWTWIFLAGGFLGLVGIRYVRRRRAALRERDPGPTRPDPERGPRSG